MYKLNSIETAMQGPFKNNPSDNTPNTFEKPLSTCDDYTKMNTIESGAYYRDITKNHKFEMEQSISERAVFALNDVKFTSLAVDSLGGGSVENHVIYLGLSDGRVIKLAVKPIVFKNSVHYQPTILSEIQMFENRGAPVDSLLLFNKPGVVSRRLVAISAQQIKSISLQPACEVHDSCQKCVIAQDPYCAWSKIEFKCVYVPSRPLNS